MDIKEYIRLFERKLGRDLILGFFGLGISNQALIAALPDKYLKRGYNIRTDGLIVESLPKGARLLCSCDAFSSVCEDILFLSPSVNRRRADFMPFVNKGVVFSSDFELFFLENPKNVFCISGSDGKSTTSFLASSLASFNSSPAVLCGNFGIPYAKLEYSKDKLYIAEISSFNLEYFTPKSKRALITNIHPNHLNWHKSFDEYKDTKLSLLRYTDEPVIFADDMLISSAFHNKELFCVYSLIYSFDELKARFNSENFVTVENGYIAINNEKVLAIRQMKKTERYTLINMLGAISLSLGYCDNDRISSVASSFSGLPHRCELVLEKDGVKYINSSIDTTPKRSAATLSEINAPIKILLGGRAKGLSLVPLINAMAGKVFKIAIYGEAAEDFFEAISAVDEFSNIEIKKFALLKDAIDFLLESALPGDTVLLSPAATGYGEFKDFKQRGDFFSEYIRKHFDK